MSKKEAILKNWKFVLFSPSGARVEFGSKRGISCTCMEYHELLDFQRAFKQVEVTDAIFSIRQITGQ